MNVFLLEQPKSEEEVDELLEFSPRFVRLPTGKSKMLWLPQVVWEAEAYAVLCGFDLPMLMENAIASSEESGFPLEITYPFTCYCAAHKAAEEGVDLGG